MAGQGESLNLNRSVDNIAFLTAKNHLRSSFAHPPIMLKGAPVRMLYFHFP